MRLCTEQSSAALRPAASASVPASLGRRQRGRGSLLAEGRRTGVLLTGVLLTGGLGCSDLGGKPELPSGIPNQEALKTVQGARQLYQGALLTFEPSIFLGTSGQTASPGAVLPTVFDQGLLSDELTVSRRRGSQTQYDVLASRGDNSSHILEFYFDSRNVEEASAIGSAASGVTDDYVAVAYQALQLVRGQSAEAIGALAQYDTAEKALRGHLYALTGYAELYLADLFCSGVPLSTLDYNGDFTYQPGSPTDAVYRHALAQFTQALPLVADSASWLNLARVGRGRAFLNLGEYDSAAAAVHAVPTAFQYSVPVNWSSGNPAQSGSALSWDPFLTETIYQGGYPLDPLKGASVADSEGGRGLPYRSSGDPRTAVVFVGYSDFGDSLFFPAKYGSAAGLAPLVVASGIEARLIEAEAALHGVSVGSDWLTILNTLRQTYAPTLGALSDPGDSPKDTARVRLLFQERAAWLFLDGHRLGDMRRLLRHYLWPLNWVFPTGVYPVPFPQTPQYGSYVELPIPQREQQVNPFFHGCLQRGI